VQKQNHKAIPVATDFFNSLLGKGGTSMGINFGTAAFCLNKQYLPSNRGGYLSVKYFETDEFGVPFKFPPKNVHLAQLSSSDLSTIPGAPIAYWISEKTLKIIGGNEPIGDYADAKVGLQTGNNNRFMKYWFEVNVTTIGLNISSKEVTSSEKIWFPCNKGGNFRKWYGNHEYVVNWRSDGIEIRSFTDDDGKLRSYPRNTSY
jgi:hypothetical protein